MAISSEIDVPHLGMTASYHRIAQVLFQYHPDHKVKGSVGTAFVTVVSYPTQEARDAGRGGVDKGEFQIRFGANVEGTLDDGREETTYEDVKRLADGSMDKDEDGNVIMVPVTIPTREATKIPTIASDEPTRAEIYAAIMALPQFTDASEV